MGASSIMTLIQASKNAMMKLKTILEWQEAVEVHMNAAKMGWPKHDFFGRWWWMLYHEAKRLLD